MEKHTIKIPSSGYTQEATCGMQVCQHPLCWSTNRQVARGLLHFPTQEKDSVRSRSKSFVKEDDEESMFEGLPTVTILNMLDDYGFDSKDRYPSTSWSTIIGRRSGKLKSKEMVNIPPEGSHIVPRLTLKALASHSTDDVIVPANTPLQSSHGFGDYHEYHSPLSHHKPDSHRQAFTETPVSRQASQIRIQPPNYHKVKMEFEAGDSIAIKTKRLMVWCPASDTKRRRQSPHSGIGRPKVPPSLKAVSLPLNTVPEYTEKLRFFHKPMKGKMPQYRYHYSTKKESKVRVDKSTSTTLLPGPPAAASRATPQEIAQLRKVPVDVLMHVLHQAQEKGVITPKQTQFLLRQVVGPKEKLPSIQESKPQPIEEVIEVQDMIPKAPLATKNIKILDHEERIYSPRTVVVEPVYKMDGNVVPRETIESQGKVPAATNISEFTNEGKLANAPEIPHVSELPVTTDSKQMEAEDDLDSKYNEKLREVALIRNISREAPATPKKTPVKYVATLFEDTAPQTPPIKPFHYPRSPREIFLGPIPSPPPPSPPTDRDSAYDGQAGGSTMLVNPSSTGPPTITSYGEKNPSSPSGSKTPTTGRDADARTIKIGHAVSKPGSQRRRYYVSSPFGSSTGEGWPQINEEDFMMTGETSDIVGSPMPSYTDEEMRVLSRNESTSSVRGETPIADKFQSFQQSEIHSPAPPPPSPEPMGVNGRNNEDVKTPSSSRGPGAATALGLTALSKDSSQTSPEIAPGSTPTPVVSSVTSSVETPLGRVTRMHRLSSTPAIAETPNENESDEEELPVQGEIVLTSNEKQDPVEANDTDNTRTSTTKIDGQELEEFEKNVSPEIAKQELESEMEKLEIS